MTTRRKKFLILVLFYGAITIIRETGLLSVNYYHSQLNTHCITNWTSSSTSTSFIPENKAKWDKIVANPCNGSRSLKNVPVTVCYKDQQYGDDTSSGCENIMVCIDQISSGILLWNPLIKWSSFNTKVICNVYQDSKYWNGPKIVSASQSHTSTILVSGNITIWGICSYREARDLVNKAVMKQVYNQIKERLNQN